MVERPMALQTDFTRVLKENSRTFFIPIARLPARLQEAVGCAYLCMRAIDEIEDHPVLDGSSKAALLRGLGPILQAQVGVNDSSPSIAGLESFFDPYRSVLPEV